MPRLTRGYIQSLSLFILLHFIPGSAFAQDQVGFEHAFPNLTFERPVAVRNDGTNDWLYVVEQFGRIHIVENTSDATETKVFLDINDIVIADPIHIEAGLLGLAFHPEYERNGYFYIYYLSDNPLRAVLARYERSVSDATVANPDSEVILFVLERHTTRHNGGDLAFGPDGYLYVSVGDGSTGEDQFNNAQDRSTLFGSLLRIDVDQASDSLNYGIPSDNPFASNIEGFREEIFAYGLRNPWRFSFDAETGQLWVADVGESDWEEVNLVQHGNNYGWPLAAGDDCRREACQPDDYVMPVWSYPHTHTSDSTDRTNRSVTGGYVYRGSEIPSLVGRYVYADWSSGILWVLDYDGVNPAVNSVLLETGRFISGFGEDTDHELYALQYFLGKVLRLIETGSTDVEKPELPGTLRLDLAGPNPFHQTTTLEFESDRPGTARVSVYDLLGREVAILFEGHLPAGVTREVVLDAARLASGIYVCRLDVAGRTQTQRVVHVL